MTIKIFLCSIFFCMGIVVPAFSQKRFDEGYFKVLCQQRDFTRAYEYAVSCSNIKTTPNIEAELEHQQSGPLKTLLYMVPLLLLLVANRKGDFSVNPSFLGSLFNPFLQNGSSFVMMNVFLYVYGKAWNDDSNNQLALKSLIQFLKQCSACNK